MDGRMERGRGRCRGGGVGGQRLKLHHKSHPERKHEVTPPPPFSIHPSLPCGPSLSSLLPSHLFVSVYREYPIDGPGVFYITPSCTSNTNSPISPHPSSLHPPLTSVLPACCKPINHSADPIGKGGEKNGGGWLKTQETGR